MSKDYSASQRGFEAFNRRAALSVGWGEAFKIIERVSAEDMGFGKHAQDVMSLAHEWSALADGDVTEADFGVAVEAFQAKHKLVTDRKLGRGTWRKVCALVQPELAPFPEKSFCFAGLMVPLTDSYVRTSAAKYVEQKIVVNHTKYQSNHWRPGHKSRRLILGHWGGFNPGSCFNVLENDGNSTSIIFDYDLRPDGLLNVYQTVDLANTAFHAGPGFNHDSIGFDIARTPLTRFASRYPSSKIIQNPSKRGEREVVDLPVGVGLGVRHTIQALADLLDIPFGPYPGDAVQKIDENTRGVFGHHHLTWNRWDIAPWRRHIWRDDA